MDTTRSVQLFARARRLIPGGVDSPVRAFGAVGGTPRFARSGSGCHLTDVDGNRYIDMVGSWGPLLLGHAHPRVIAAIEAALPAGTSFGAPLESEVTLAEALLSRVPAADAVRFVNSGTEATMSAIRVARGATGRELMVKFAGNYHGHADGLLVAAGSGALTTGVPSSAGVPAATASATLVARYNDAEGLRRLFDQHGARIAAVIVEPVAGNMGVVPPEPGFLQALQDVPRQHGAALIVDEVMTGFRVARGGAVERYALDPDLITWGKVIGGGLPVGAYGGKTAFMEQVSPLGPVYQAGTLSGNPLAMAAGSAMLDAVDEAGDVYAVLETRGQALEAGLAEAAANAGVAVRVNRVGSMLTVFFCRGEVRDFDTAAACDLSAFARWFHGLLARGVWWPPSQFESAFLSYAHRASDVDAVVTAAAGAFADVAAGAG
jgi:glutamate-1-semialdehyde 2,1-aminomutase